MNQGPPTPRSTAQDVAALKSSVRSYFGALASYNFLHLARFSSGPLHQLAEWSKAEWGGVCTCPPTPIHIEMLDVTQLSGNEATMSFGASSDRGSIYTGPLRATRGPDGWTVDDYVVGGQDARRSVVTGLGTVQSRDGIRIRVVGLWIPNRTGDLWMVVANGTGSLVKAVDLNVSGPLGTVAAGRGLSPNVRMMAPHATVTTDMGWSSRGPVRAGQRFILHPVFVNLSTGQRTEFDLQVTIPRTG